jgi:2-oxo-4-hydroxy-4-carboxy-5-ureidoimidazoline decarboxylase
VTLERLNAAPAAEAAEALRRCCGSRAWVEAMLDARPYVSCAALHGAAEECWDALDERDVREAFTHHPRIGDVAALRAKFASTAAWAGREQAGAAAAGDAALAALAQGNRDYEARFGHLFIVCASGKSAPEMLAHLRERMPNDAATELRVAAAEQAKIMHLRLDKLLEESP